MIQNPIIPVILSGGSGTRLWPLSRESFPKQYLSINSSYEETLLQKTHLRINGLSNLKEPILICNEEHRFIVAEQMREINTKPYSILLEPLSRNTAPAIILSAIKALEDNDDPILLVLSSDHEIQDEKQFVNVLEKGFYYANQNRLVSFGVIPTSPETGYGYIKAESPFINKKIIGKKIEEFTEKPDSETAKDFLKDRSYTWNSGIFMFKAKVIINEVKKFYPKIFKICQESINNSELDLEFQRINKEIFSNCPNISIDVAVMEKTKKGTVLPLDVGWSDIGSWQAIWERSVKDHNKNHILGNALVENSNNCYIRSENKLIVGIGLKNLIVVDTNDALLILNNKYSQEIKNIVNKLKENKIPQGQKHSKIFRPWGHYISIAEDQKWQLKLIHVKPGEKLSLQMHNHRSEHWIVVNGTAKVELDNEVSILKENQSTYIPVNSKHRLSNPTLESLILIEVQSGTYLGEDDIVRFEDKYNRIS